MNGYLHDIFPLQLLRGDMHINRLLRLLLTTSPPTEVTTLQAIV